MSDVRNPLNEQDFPVVLIFIKMADGGRIDACELPNEVLQAERRWLNRQIFLKI
jgi:hypothetical protein